MAFKIEPKSILSRVFRVLVVPLPLLGGIIAYRLTLGSTTAHSRWYDRLTKSKRLGSGGTIARQGGTIAWQH